MSLQSKTIAMNYDSWSEWHKININQIFNFMSSFEKCTWVECNFRRRLSHRSIATMGWYILHDESPPIAFQNGHTLSSTSLGRALSLSLDLSPSSIRFIPFCLKCSRISGKVSKHFSLLPLPVSANVRFNFLITRFRCDDQCFPRHTQDRLNSLGSTFLANKPEPFAVRIFDLAPSQCAHTKTHKHTHTSTAIPRTKCKNFKLLNQFHFQQKVLPTHFSTLFGIFLSLFLGFLSAVALPSSLAPCYASTYITSLIHWN